ncbi:MAG: hypothetical protein JSS09_04345 [Verrucomicrobia bacterium]|nr:hypothetical protein [Verrucomicrobiota bacterium]
MFTKTQLDVPKLDWAQTRSFSTQMNLGQRKKIRAEIEALKGKLIKIQALAERSTRAGEKSSAQDRAKETLEKITKLELTLNPTKSFFGKVLSSVYHVFIPSHQDYADKVLADPMKKSDFLKELKVEEVEIVDELINMTYAKKEDFEKDAFKTKIVDRIKIWNRFACDFIIVKEELSSFLKLYQENSEIIEDVFQGLVSFTDLITESDWIADVKDEDLLRKILIELSDKHSNVMIFDRNIRWIEKIKDVNTLEDVLLNLADKNPARMIENIDWLEKVTNVSVIEKVLMELVKKVPDTMMAYPNWIDKVQDLSVIRNILMQVVKTAPTSITYYPSWVRKVKDFKLVGDVFYALDAQSLG